MAYKILSIGTSLPSDAIEAAALDSDRSLLDADIVLLEPGIRHGTYWSDHQGKPALDDSDSFKTKNSVAHWRREIRAAIDAGKLVVVYLVKPYDVFVDTGQRQTSGTGRNAKITRIVDELRSYSIVPLEVSFVAASGTEIRPVKDLGVLAPYWAEFASVSPYQLYIEGTLQQPLLRTKHGDRVVGAVVRKGVGALLLLPPLDLELAGCLAASGKHVEWSEEAKPFGKRLVAALCALADSIRASSAVTPAPEWASRPEYRLEAEAVLEREIAEKTKALESIEVEVAGLKDRHAAAGGPRRLLYEGGKQLEASILEALRCMGFVAEPFKNADSEFDAVFVSEEGRFLGEAEGKDTKAINIDKITQLERNIQEDFARDEVKEHARGVLFGNAFRLSAPESRGEYFTEKCMKSAVRLGVALVRTSDLFRPVEYLLRHDAPEYARACRRAILETKGSVVIFPSPPQEPHNLDQSEAVQQDVAPDDRSPAAPARG
jgi:hypothetical protein